MITTNRANRERIAPIVKWQMILGTIGFLEEVVRIVIEEALGGQGSPQWVIMSASVALLGGGTIQQIGKGGGNGK